MRGWQQKVFIIKADFNNNGRKDIAVSENFHWGNAGGNWDIYFQNEYGRYKYIDEIFFHHYAISIKALEEGKSSIIRYGRHGGGEGSLWESFFIEREIEEGEESIVVYHDQNGNFSLSKGEKRGHELIDRYMDGFNPVSQRYTVSEYLMRVQNKERGFELNRKGEELYHQGSVEEAIEYYKEAIDLVSNVGQFHSNLGLAYQKIGKLDRAIQENKDAISMTNSKITRASSYYNLARIYEEKKEWEEALENYKNGLEYREHDAYKNGIERIERKLNN